MVQVSVSDEDGAQRVFLFAQIFPIGEDIVHSQHIRFREHHTRIDHDDIAAIFYERHVLAHFPQAAQGHDT